MKDEGGGLVFCERVLIRCPLMQLAKGSEEKLNREVNFLFKPELISCLRVRFLELK